MPTLGFNMSGGTIGKTQLLAMIDIHIIIDPICFIAISIASKMTLGIRDPAAWPHFLPTIIMSCVIKPWPLNLFIANISQSIGLPMIILTGDIVNMHKAVSSGQ